VGLFRIQLGPEVCCGGTDLVDGTGVVASTRIVTLHVTAGKTAL
jgi:hypothetical protein